ncbi:MAG: hypothetical protein U5L72_02540 [Bacteroidales bacterium]|nr:hypothetical protein [Bacteroidales bacterium]
MKRKISVTLVLLMAFISCEGPETTVTNMVGRNGSVLRKVEMSHSSFISNTYGFKVPVDSTWNLKDSLFISAEGDTTWFILAEKLFESAEAINEAYLADTATNSSVTRTAVFSRKFKWFTTTWYFAEKCERSLLHGYPMSDYLKPEEIAFLELPDKISFESTMGPDSLHFRSLIDSVQQHTEQWMMGSLISEFIEDAGALCDSSGKDSVTTEILRSHENDFYSLVGFDAKAERILTAVFGDSLYAKFKPEFDSALTLTENKFERSWLFESYTMQIVMPARLKSTNGYAMDDGTLAWPVTGNDFLTDDYIMYAESRDINYWAVIITLLLLTAMTYFSRRIRRK